MNERLKQMIQIISKGDTHLAESFFRQPGGRRYLENITLILINTLPEHYGTKEDLFHGFVEVLDNLEGRIRQQKQGEEILNNVFNPE